MAEALLGNRKRIALDADHAHLAKHGYFADRKFRSVLQLDPKLFERGRGDERAGAGREARWSCRAWSAPGPM